MKKRRVCRWRPEYLDDRALDTATFAVHDRNGRRVRRGVLRERRAERDGACKRPGGQQQPRTANRATFVLGRQTSPPASRCSHSRKSSQERDGLGVAHESVGAFGATEGRATLPGVLSFGAGGSLPAFGADWHKAEAEDDRSPKEPKRRQGDVPAVDHSTHQKNQVSGPLGPSTLTDSLSFLNGGHTEHEKAQVNLSLIAPP